MVYEWSFLVVLTLAVSSVSEAAIDDDSGGGYPGHQYEQPVTFPAYPTYSPAYTSGQPAASSTSSSCRYWCRTRNLQYYCCQSGRPPTPPTREKPGFCPPVRRYCPNVTGHYDPRPCNYDNECSGSDKCCFDRCLTHRTCKPSDKRPGGYSEYPNSGDWK